MASVTYFPATVSEFVRNWYGQHLAAMNEPSLFEAAARGESALRFLWLRTFDPPMAIRLTREGEDVKLVATRLSGQGGYEPGAIAERIERTLSVADWLRIEAGLDLAHFDDPPNQDGLGADGAQWVVERARNGSWRMVDRWSPEREGPHGEFRRACDAFLALVGDELITGNVY